jgi:hypothetical protein
MIADTIVKTALNFVGEEEIKGNMGFKDEQFQKMMEAVGWRKKQAWCAYFTELAWKLAYIQSQDIVKELNGLFSASAVETFKNFEASRWTTSDQPEKGGLVVWQRYQGEEPHWSGHIGIVKKVQDPLHVLTIEGNTNDSGGREGIEVAERVRTLTPPDGRAGLKFIGCVYPLEP